MHNRVTLFVPCLVDQFFPRAALGMVRTLKKLGCAVDYPTGQTCCGQPAFNAGHRREAAALAERFIALFGKSDVIVAPSGSCVSMVRHYYRELDLDARHRRQVGEIAGKVFEFSEFIVRRMGVTDLEVSFPHRVTYHDSCHLLRELRVRDEPRQLLRAVKGLELVEMENADRCCGFGGAFSIKFPELSRSIGCEKASFIAATGARYVVSADAGCLMQIAGTLERSAPGVRAIHLAELLGMHLS